MPTVASRIVPLLYPKPWRGDGETATLAESSRDDYGRELGKWVEEHTNANIYTVAPNTKDAQRTMKEDVQRGGETKRGGCIYNQP